MNECNRTPIKLWVDQGREFHNKFVQVWLGNNNILMYSIHNKGKSLIVEGLIETIRAKTYLKMTSNDSKSYLSCLNKLVDQ